MSRETLVRFSHGAETQCCPSATPSGTEPVAGRQSTDTAVRHTGFYIAALSILFFLDFVSGDLALTGF